MLSLITIRIIKHFYVQLLIHNLSHIQKHEKKTSKNLKSQICFSYNNNKNSIVLFTKSQLPQETKIHNQLVQKG